jgi:hypothetical protein
MIMARAIDYDHALLDPRAVFKEPREVLACAELDPAQKRRILECWRHEAMELQTADDEAMSGGEEPMLNRVQEALRALEREAASARH